MSTKREEERNEKIIRGLMKLPPNRRCINCNSLGPQYVCTNFWTSICTVCSGIHREFTHRVKSVSMAKFTSQEVDALQKGGNQRAKELFLKAWDPQMNRLPDNSNVDKLREFIKNVYVLKKYSMEKSSDKPPRDPQSLRSREDETRKASSYHSYSQSPPYDFQYEEQRSGKHAPTLARRTGSDHGLYDGKLADFLGPSHSSFDSFTSEGSYPRASDYSFSSGGDAFKSDVLSPSPRGDIGSPSSEASGEMSNKVPHLRQQSNASSGSFGSFDSSSSFKYVNFVLEVRSESTLPAEDHFHKPSTFPSLPQSSAPESFNGLDLFSAPSAPHSAANTLPTVSNSQPLPVSAQPVNVATQSSFSSIPAFIEQQLPPISRPPLVDMLTTQQQPELKQPPSLDLFAALLEQQSSIPQPSSVDLFDTSSQQPPKIQEASQMPQPPPVDLFDAQSQLQSKVMLTSQRPETSSLDLFNAPPQLSTTPQTSELLQAQALDLFSVPQQQSETIQPPPIDLFAGVSQQQLATSPRGSASNVLSSGNGGWATFDMLQSMPIDAKSSASATVSSSGGNFLRSSNPFTVGQSSYQDSAAHEPSALSHDFGREHLQNIGVNFNNTDLWNAFDSSSGEQINPSVLKTDEQSGLHFISDANSIVFGAYEELHNGSSVRTPGHIEPPSSGVLSHLSMDMMPIGFPIASGVAGIQLEADDKPTNPFDLPYGSHMESGTMSQFWDMSSLQAALPNTKMPNSSVGGVNESWFPHNPVSSYVPAGVSYDSSVSLGFMAGKAPTTQIPNIHMQGPVASVGGNPFA